MTQAMALERLGALRGTVHFPGDKSISHRALLLAAASHGRCAIENLSTGADVLATRRCLEQLGAVIRDEGEGVVVEGGGRLRSPAAPLGCGNSGTTMRLLVGLLAGMGVEATLDGDESLRRRPMGRVLDPLRAMGAAVEGARDGTGGERAPLRVRAGGPLVGATHELAVASAQVKSALLLAGLFAEGETRVREPQLSRDHTERMLGAFGVDVGRQADGFLSITGPRALRAPASLFVPGDPSSAAFFVVLGLLVEGSRLELQDIAANETRTGWLRVLHRMDADVSMEKGDILSSEPTCTLRVAHTAELTATEIAPEEIPSLVDEIPILAVAATQARGSTRIRGAGELRVKESDRLAEVARQLGRMGARIEEHADGLTIHGPTPLRGAPLSAASDHRMAMSLAVAASIAEGRSLLEGAEWAEVSFPGFYDRVHALAQRQA